LYHYDAALASAETFSIRSGWRAKVEIEHTKTSRIRSIASGLSEVNVVKGIVRLGTYLELHSFRLNEILEHTQVDVRVVGSVECIPGYVAKIILGCSSIEDPGRLETWLRERIA
jgi:hypothetical protein